MFLNILSHLRNVSHFIASSRQLSVSESVELEEVLEAALSKIQEVATIQPIVEMRPSRIVGQEATCLSPATAA